MNMKLRFATIFGLAVSFQMAQAADVTGKITLNGKPPPERVLPLDLNCAKLHPAGKKPTTRFYAVGEGNALGDVVVILKGAPAKSSGASAKPAVLDQVGCEYTPTILAIQTGQKLIVKNSDPVLHNVHPTPDPKIGNPESNKAQLPKGPNLEYSFQKPEMFLRYKCDVHPWMFSWVTVLDHPYFAVSGKDGTYKISDVPPGKYTLEIHHRKAGTQTKQIEVAASGAKADFTMEAK